MKTPRTVGPFPPGRFGSSDAKGCTAYLSLCDTKGRIST
jgi:hypothetical protein